MKNIPTVHDMPDVRGKRVLLRSELNVPVENGVVVDEYRILKAVPTINYLKEKGAKVIVIAHLGRNPEDSLEPVHIALQKHVSGVRFVHDVVGEEAKEAVHSLKEGEVLLLENVRSNPGEKKNDESFGRALANLADYYVDDAFGAMHRSHASVTGIPTYIPGYAGLLVQAEIEALSKGLSPASPSLFILGGAKFETKEPLLKAIQSRYETIFIGGALANDFLKAQGHEIGVSLVSETWEAVSGLLEAKNILVPVDVLVEGPDGVQEKDVESVGREDKIVDIGQKSIAMLQEYISHAACVLWNGPLGYYEGGYGKATEAVAQHIAESNGYSIVGGGDTVACVRKNALEEEIDFISTGGGAMLDFLVDGALPGIEVLKDSQS